VYGALNNNIMKTLQEFIHRSLALGMYRNIMKQVHRMKDLSQKDYLRQFVKQEFRVFDSGVDQFKLTCIRRRVEEILTIAEMAK
jgi:hypothetical protein